MMEKAVKRVRPHVRGGKPIRGYVADRIQAHAVNPMPVLGVSLDATGRPIRGVIDVHAPGDYGCDYLGDDKFRMVPSGDVLRRWLSTNIKD